MITAIRFLSELRNKTRQFADFLHFGEFSFEIAKVNTKCDFVFPIVFSAKRKGEMRRGGNIYQFT